MELWLNTALTMVKNYLLLLVIIYIVLLSMVLEKGYHLLTEDDVSKFEVMIGGEVKGWQTRKDIDQIFKDYE